MDSNIVIEEDNTKDMNNFLDEVDEDKQIKSVQHHVQDPLSVLYKYHPECILDYIESVNNKLQILSPGSTDNNHKSQPFLTIFEKTNILGFRANQIAQGARPFIVVPPQITSTLEIAKLELEQRRLPFIVKRPMPDGTYEYFRLSDLMIIN